VSELRVDEIGQGRLAQLCRFRNISRVHSNVNIIIRTVRYSAIVWTVVVENCVNWEVRFVLRDQPADQLQCKRADWEKMAKRTKILLQNTDDQNFWRETKISYLVIRRMTMLFLFCRTLPPALSVLLLPGGTGHDVFNMATWQVGSAMYFNGDRAKIFKK